jgi:hypothetical protein
MRGFANGCGSTVCRRFVARRFRRDRNRVRHSGRRHRIRIDFGVKRIRYAVGCHVQQDCSGFYLKRRLLGQLGARVLQVRAVGKGGDAPRQLLSLLGLGIADAERGKVGGGAA